MKTVRWSHPTNAEDKKFVFLTRPIHFNMGLLPDTKNCGLCVRWGCRERIRRHQLERKPLVSDPGMHYGTCMTHVPWCMSGSLTRCAGENVPGIAGRCATLNFTHLARGPNEQMSRKAGRWRVLSVSDGYHFRIVMFRLLLWECFETLHCH